MTIRTDPALFGSDFARNANDAYYTEARVGIALAQRIPADVKTIWEPCCGRGDLAGVFHMFGKSVAMSDIDISNVDPRARKLKIPVEQHDFLHDGCQRMPKFIEGAANNIDMIATNPPFGDLAEDCIRQALTFSNVRYFAFLLRSEWNHGGTRIDLFRSEPFAKEIVLTWRPRWDWWLTPEQKRAAKIAAGKDPDKPDASPRHNFSWFIWDREHEGPPTQEFAKRDESV